MNKFFFIFYLFKVYSYFLSSLAFGKGISCTGDVSLNAGNVSHGDCNSNFLNSCANSNGSITIRLLSSS